MTPPAGSPTLPNPGKKSEPIRRDIQKGDVKMKLTPPKVITWWIALILGVLGLLGHLGVIAALSPYAFWLMTVGLALLLLATLIKDL
jgi:hypothetical protein